MSHAQLLVFDSTPFDDRFSSFSNLGNKAVINFLSQHFNYSDSIFETFVNQIILGEDGGLLTYQTIDSADANGYNVLLTAITQKDSLLYHFGGLFSYDATQFRFFVHSTDYSLNKIRDTIINFDNSSFSVSDVSVDSNDFIVCGSLSGYNDTTSIFVFRMNNDLQIIDSLLIPFPFAYYYNIGITVTDQRELNLFISSNVFLKDLLLKIDIDSLSIQDTLFARQLVDTGFTIWGNSNCYRHFINDSTLLSPCEIYKDYWTPQWDTTFLQIAWLKWHVDGTLLDTMIPWSDTIMSNRMGLYKSSILVNDTLVMAFTHNDNIYSPLPSDSTTVGILFSTLDGTPIRVKYFGSDHNYMVENLFRFDNGNYLIITRRRNFWGGNQNNTDAIVLWLTDNHGDLLQRIPLPYTNVSNLKVFPNPAPEVLFVEIPKHLQKDGGSIQIYNGCGSLILSTIVHPFTDILPISTSSYSSGVYFIILSSNDRVRLGSKFLIQ